MGKSGKLKVLMVEDEHAQMELLNYNFQADGYQVYSAMDGEEGKLLAEEVGPDLIVLDWMLPNLSGIEICRRLTRGPIQGKFRIIMLTARGEESRQGSRTCHTGADDYVDEAISQSPELLTRARAHMLGARRRALVSRRCCRSATLRYDRRCAIARRGRPATILR